MLFVNPNCGRSMSIHRGNFDNWRRVFVPSTVAMQLILTMSVVHFDTGILGAQSIEDDDEIVWTSRPTKIDIGKQSYERLPAKPSLSSLYPLKFARSSHYRVLNSVSFVVGRQRYRLAGLDPVEPNRICQFATGARWSCGVKSKVALSRLISGKLLECKSNGEVGGFTVLECLRNGEDLGARLAATGNALLPSDDIRYADDIEVARGRKVGVWAEQP